MGAHGGRGARGVAGGDAVEDGAVFGAGDLEAARRQDQAAGAVEIGAGVLDDALHLGKAHVAEDDVVELEVALVEAVLVVDLDGGALVAHVALQRFDQFGAVVAGDDADGLGLQRLADQHVFEHVGDADQRHGGAALGQDIDETLGLQPRQGLGDREARDAETLADGALVDDFARLQIERDDGLAQGVGDENRDVAARRGGRGCQKLVGTCFHLHANMLVGRA